MKQCDKCKGWQLEEGDSIPKPDIFIRKRDGSLIRKTKYPKGFCECEDD